MDHGPPEQNKEQQLGLSPDGRHGRRPRGEGEKRKDRKVRRELEVRAGGGCGWGSREAEAKKVIVRSWLPLSIVILDDSHGPQLFRKK